MATYIISFRIAESGNDAERYKSFVDAVEKENEETLSWEETTSFIIIDSSKTPKMLKLWLSFSDIDSTEGDKFVVINTETNKADHYGVSYPSTFGGFFD